MSDWRDIPTTVGMCIVVAVILIVLAITVNIDNRNQHISEARVSACTVETKEYAGHRYIFFCLYNKVKMIHDPDCPCHARAREDKQ